MGKEKRMTRTIRVYEPTAQLIEAIMRHEKGKHFADVVEEWAKRLYPDSYETVIESTDRIDNVLGKEHPSDRGE